VKKKNDCESFHATMSLMSSNVQYNKVSCMIYKGITGKDRLFVKQPEAVVYMAGLNHCRNLMQFLP
jgi:hypothetical protein